jgi:hypothetical protein
MSEIEQWMSKAELIQQVNQAYAEMSTILDALLEDQMIEPGVMNGYSIKDLLAHLAAWELLCVNWIRTSLQGEQPVRWAPGFEVQEDDPLESLNRLNEQIYKDNRDTTLRETLADFRIAHEKCLGAIQLLSDDELNDSQLFNWLRGHPLWQIIAANSYEHYREHLEQIETWFDREQ